MSYRCHICGTTIIAGEGSQHRCRYQPTPASPVATASEGTMTCAKCGRGFADQIVRLLDGRNLHPACAAVEESERHGAVIAARTAGVTVRGVQHIEIAQALELDVKRQRVRAEKAEAALAALRGRIETLANEVEWFKPEPMSWAEGILRSISKSLRALAPRTNAAQPEGQTPHATAPQPARGLCKSEEDPPVAPQERETP